MTLITVFSCVFLQPHVNIAAKIIIIIIIIDIHIIILLLVFI